MIEDKEKNFGEELGRLMKEKENVDKIILELKQTLETTKSSYEEQLQQQETNARDSQMELKQRLKEAESLLSESEKRRKDIEEVSKSRYLNWSKKEHVFQCSINSHLRAVQVFLSYFRDLLSTCHFKNKQALFMSGFAIVLCFYQA